MEKKLQKLKEILAEVEDLHSAAGLLSWDQQTYMPPGGTEGRGFQIGTLEKLAHIKSTAEQVGQLLDDLAPYAAQLDADSTDARLVKVARRNYEKDVKVSPEWVAEYAQVTAAAHPIWAGARKENNFARFQPVLEKILELRRQYAGFFAPYDHIYDPLLDDFEPGLKTAEMKEIFTALRQQQVALIKQIAARPQIDDTFIWKNYAEQKQWGFGVEVITRFGYDWQCGRQDKSPHPFTSGFGIGDVRITTRFAEDNGISGLMSTMHEAGHAMYEQGINPALGRTPLARGASLAVHESQSRMWENLVGRSLAFWEYFYPRYQTLFSENLKGVPLEKFYKAVNKVQPSLIRVEADEATYNLHIMLRLELEIDLIEGSLAVKDLPEAWNSRMQEYLGIVPPNDSLGVLQDVHWSMGLVGYFSTYALGNVISVQLWEAIQRAIPDLEEQIRQGEFAALLGWLRENIHQHGAKFEPQELVRRVTGEGIDSAPYVRYLRNKYSQVYGL
jgi:carboxypeptidase Taq